MLPWLPWFQGSKHTEIHDEYYCKCCGYEQENNAPNGQKWFMPYTLASCHPAPWLHTAHIAWIHLCSRQNLRLVLSSLNCAVPQKSVFSVVYIPKNRWIILWQNVNSNLPALGSPVCSNNMYKWPTVLQSSWKESILCRPTSLFKTLVKEQTFGPSVHAQILVNHSTCFPDHFFCLSSPVLLTVEVWAADSNETPGHATSTTQTASHKGQDGTYLCFSNYHIFWHFSPKGRKSMCFSSWDGSGVGPQKQYFFTSPTTGAWLTSFGEHSLHQHCPFQAYPVLAWQTREHFQTKPFSSFVFHDKPSFEKHQNFIAEKFRLSNSDLILIKCSLRYRQKN
jgi:hypothetical protein